MSKLIACLALSVALTTVALGTDDDPNRAALEGIPGVYVLVESFSEEQKSAGFNRRIFQTDVELKLRLAGITVWTREEALAAPGTPHLYLNVHPLYPYKRGAVSPYAIRLDLKQIVQLARDPSTLVVASTWWTRSIGNGGIPHIRETAKNHTDEFINAWLSVNPRD